MVQSELIMRSSRNDNILRSRNVILLRLGLLIGIALGYSAPVSGAETCAALPPRQPMPTEARPQFLDDANWRAHLAALDHRVDATSLSEARLVFLGDSITEIWTPLIFEQFYGRRQALNLGVSGDRTQGLLWRLQRLASSGDLRPRLIVLLIGTNNLFPGVRAEDVALGIAEVLRQIRRITPQSRILVVGLLPRGPSAADPMRRVAAQVNQLIAHCADHTSIVYADPGAMLLNGRGDLSDKIAYDYLHPTPLGYGILAAGLEPIIHRLLGE
jgi:lysophospholipase L1-like esterase